MTNLNYLKDHNGKYIVKNISKDITANYLSVTGNFSENFLIGKQNWEKQLNHKVNKCISNIENNICCKYKITEKDFLFEKIIMEVLDEEEFNPLFKFLTPTEKEEYTKFSQKIRISMEFEFYIPIKKHLQFEAFWGFFQKKF